LAFGRDDVCDHGSLRRKCEVCTRDDEIAALAVAVRRGIAQIERMLPYMQWDGMDGEQDETNAHVTLDLMREALAG